MLRYYVPLSTSLIWANHSLHMPCQTILAFYVIFPQPTSLFFLKKLALFIHAHILVGCH